MSVIDSLSERERERLPVFLSVNTTFYISTFTSIPILRTMSQLQMSPAPATPNSEEDVAGVDFSSVEAFRASLAGFYGMFSFHRHRRMP
jgi:urea transporter